MISADSASDISVIIPAYNEEKRLGPFLEKVIRYASASSLNYEVIVVDDGSRDKTASVALSFAPAGIKLVRLQKNSGKGAAVKRGFMEARGATQLFMDADGSVGPEEIEKNLNYLAEGADIVIGSRVLKSSDRVLEVKWYRLFLGRVFNFFVKSMLAANFEDTQCGFKMFKREAAKSIFARTNLNGFGFDIEALFLAHRMGYRVKEIPVSWK